MTKHKEVEKKVEQKKAEEVRPKNPPYLKHVPTGRIYPYHPITAERGDMIPYYGEPKK